VNFHLVLLLIRQRTHQYLQTLLIFRLRIATNIDGDITWVSPNNLGTIFNGTISNYRVEAISDVNLQYRLVSGMLHQS
jgi:hypothetical protein